MTEAADHSRWRCPDWPVRAAATIALCVAAGLLFRQPLGLLIQRWADEPQYAHGFGVPLIALLLGWLRRDRIVAGTARYNLFGIAVLAVSVVLHLLAVYFHIPAIDAAAGMTAIAGIVLGVWGRRFSYGVWPAVLFLIFLFPLPQSFETLLSAPAQTFGAQEATYYIQTFGVPAVASERQILLGDRQFSVAEAFSGLRMLLVFLAVAVAGLIATRRAMWENVLILFSAIPIAFFCNVARVVATAVAFHWYGAAAADRIFYHLSAWLLLPVAVVLFFLEMKLLDWLFVVVPEPMVRVSGAAIPGVVPVSR